VNASIGVATADKSDCTVARLSTADYGPGDCLEALHEILGQNLGKVRVEPLAGESFHTGRMLADAGLAPGRGRCSRTLFATSPNIRP
jgi:hypothetical protein